MDDEDEESCYIKERLLDFLHWLQGFDWFRHLRNKRQQTVIWFEIRVLPNLWTQLCCIFLYIQLNSCFDQDDWLILCCKSGPVSTYSSRYYFKGIEYDVWWWIRWKFLYKTSALACYCQDWWMKSKKWAALLGVKLTLCWIIHVPCPL